MKYHDSSSSSSGGCTPPAAAAGAGIRAEGDTTPRRRSRFGEGAPPPRDTPVYIFSNIHVFGDKHYNDDGSHHDAHKYQDQAEAQHDIPFEFTITHTLT